MKNRDKYIIAIVAVLLIIIAVGGGTYAYWSWVSTNNTDVAFTVPSNAADLGLSATLNGNGSATAVNLIPAACTNTTYAIKETVTINSVNTTNQSATVEATLKATAFTIRSATYQPSPTNLTYLRWAVTPSNATNCTSNQVAHGDFSGITFSGTSGSNLPYTLGSISFNVPAATSSQQNTYILWIWLDSSYEHTNYGSTNSDPMQGFTVTTQWSGTIENN